MNEAMKACFRCHSLTPGVFFPRVQASLTSHANYAAMCRNSWPSPIDVIDGWNVWWKLCVSCPPRDVHFWSLGTYQPNVHCIFFDAFIYHLFFKAVGEIPLSNHLTKSLHVIPPHREPVWSYSPKLNETSPFDLKTNAFWRRNWIYPCKLRILAGSERK